MVTWSRGVTLCTAITRNWSEEDIKRNNIWESERIFSNFNIVDEGRGRQLVCTLDRQHLYFEFNRLLIERMLDIYDICKQLKNEEITPEREVELHKRLFAIIGEIEIIEKETEDRIEEDIRKVLDKRDEGLYHTLLFDNIFHKDKDDGSEQSSGF